MTKSFQLKQLSYTKRQTETRIIQIHAQNITPLGAPRGHDFTTELMVIWEDDFGKFSRSIVVY